MEPGGGNSGAPLVLWLSHTLEQERVDLLREIEKRHASVVEGLQVQMGRQSDPQERPSQHSSGTLRLLSSSKEFTELSKVPELRPSPSPPSQQLVLAPAVVPPGRLDVEVEEDHHHQVRFGSHQAMGQESAGSLPELGKRPGSQSSKGSKEEPAPLLRGGVRGPKAAQESPRRKSLEVPQQGSPMGCPSQQDDSAPAFVVRPNEEAVQIERQRLTTRGQGNGFERERPSVLSQVSSFFVPSSKDSSETKDDVMLNKMRSPGKYRRHLSFLAAAHGKNVPREGHSRLRKMIDSDMFELLTSTIILINSVVFACEMQYESFDLGRDLGYRWHGRSSEETWSGAGTLFKTLDVVFGCVYLAEMCIKLAGQKRDFFSDPWNWFDMFIVSFWAIQLQGTILTALGVDRPENLLLLRLARLAKLFRLLRVVRTMHAFDSLYLMTTALRGSFWALTWSCLLLLIFQMLMAFLTQRVLMVFYFKEADYALEDRKAVFEYFGSFSRSMLSMFEMTLANWPPVCRLLVENVTEWFIVFCVLHKLVFGFAVIGVINGVFMQETFRVAATDDRIMMRQKQRDMAVHTQKINRLFQAADASGDGILDKEEFRNVMQNPDVQMWLASMEISFLSTDTLFSMVDKDDDGTISAEELVTGAARLKGSAKSADLLALWQEQRNIRQMLTQLHEMKTTSLDCDDEVLAILTDENRSENAAPASKPMPFFQLQDSLGT